MGGRAEYGVLTEKVKEMHSARCTGVNSSLITPRGVGVYGSVRSTSARLACKRPL